MLNKIFDAGLVFCTWVHGFSLKKNNNSHTYDLTFGLFVALLNFFSGTKVIL